MSDVYQVTRRRAGKSHECLECGRKIQPGETYTLHHGVHDGSGFAVKICIPCNEIWQGLVKLCLDAGDTVDDLSFGDLKTYVCQMRDEAPTEWREWLNLRKDEK